MQEKRCGGILGIINTSMVVGWIPLSAQSMNRCWPEWFPCWSRRLFSSWWIFWNQVCAFWHLLYHTAYMYNCAGVQSYCYWSESRPAGESRRGTIMPYVKTLPWLCWSSLVFHHHVAKELCLCQTGSSSGMVAMREVGQSTDQKANRACSSMSYNSLMWKKGQTSF